MFENVARKVRKICIAFFWFYSIVMVVVALVLINDRHLQSVLGVKTLIIVVIAVVILLLLSLYFATLFGLVLAEIGENTAAIRLYANTIRSASVEYQRTLKTNNSKEKMNIEQGTTISSNSKTIDRIDTNTQGQTEVNQLNTNKYCWNCGNEIETGNKFCKHCGAKV